MFLHGWVVGTHSHRRAIHAGLSLIDPTGLLAGLRGWPLIIGAYQRRMLQTTRTALPGYGGSLRRHLYRQAQRVSGYVLGNDGPWTGLSWR